jgi:hypothetical protein
MKRAQGILKRVKEERLKDTEHSKTAPIMYVIDLEYKKYLALCYWCYETPLKKGEWLRQEIN